MNVEWKMRPYFGVFPLVFSALIHKTKSIYTTGTLKCSAVTKKFLGFAKYSLVAELPKYTSILEYLRTHTKKNAFRVARSQQHLQVYLPLKTLSCSDWGGYVRSSGITFRLTKSPTPATPRPCHHRSCVKPQQGRGAPVPEQGLLCPENLHSGGLDIWLGLSDCRRERWDEHQPIRRKEMRKHPNLTLLQNVRLLRKVALRNKQLQAHKKVSDKFQYIYSNTNIGKKQLSTIPNVYAM